MDDNRSCLEMLPNEIFIDLFQYFDAGNLYQAFHNLNFRFNTLLQSLNKLSLTLLTFNSNENNHYKIFASSVYTLKLSDEANFNLNDFINIRRLILLKPIFEQLEQLQSLTFPYLEHLSIGYKNIYITTDMPDLCRKIFSNDFPNLKSCDLFELKLVFSTPYMAEFSKLYSLKVGTIELNSYKIILSMCPNLNFFQFTIYSSEYSPIFLKRHQNLRKMIINFSRNIFSMDHCNINKYLIYVPNLKELIVYRIDYVDSINNYLDYNWFALSIYHRLPLLRQFKFYISVDQSLDSSKTDIKNICNHIQENFKQLHKDRYQSELNINVSTKTYYQN